MCEVVEVGGWWCGGKNVRVERKGGVQSVFKGPPVIGEPSSPDHTPWPRCCEGG